MTTTSVLRSQSAINTSTPLIMRLPVIIENLTCHPERSEGSEANT